MTKPKIVWNFVNADVDSQPQLPHVIGTQKVSKKDNLYDLFVDTIEEAHNKAKNKK